MKVLHKKHAAAIIEMAKRFRGEAAGPFLPLEPDDYRGAPLRICVIGKATAGAFTGGSFELTDVTAYLQSVRQTLPSSPFWNFVGDVTSQLLDTEPEVDDAGWPLRHIIWNNLMKIGAKVGNPTGALAREQSRHAAEWLREDIRKADPQVIILLTNNYELGIWLDALRLEAPIDRADWDTPPRRIVDDPGAVWSRMVDGRLLFWCRHPQGKSRPWRDGVVKYIVKRTTEARPRLVGR